MTRKYLIAAALLFAAMPATAQYRSQQFDVRPPVVVPIPGNQANDSAVRPVIGGVLGGLVGLFVVGGAGMTLDRMITSNEGSDFDGMGGWLLGAWLGEAAGVALGVRANTQRRGSLPAEILASTAVSTAGLLLFAADFDPPAALVVLAIPITQIAVVVGMERRAQQK